jgi:hypothetical protein
MIPYSIVGQLRRISAQGRDHRQPMLPMLPRQALAQQTAIIVRSMRQSELGAREGVNLDRAITPS